MEWYYQLQSELTRKYSFLLKGIEANLSTDSSGTGCLYRLSMTEDHSGLLLTLLTGGRKPTRGESLNNGRVVLFGDILSVNLPQGWALSASSRFVFVLETKEDSFSLDMDALGVTWLQVSPPLLCCLLSCACLRLVRWRVNSRRFCVPCLWSQHGDHTQRTGELRGLSRKGIFLLSDDSGMCAAVYLGYRRISAPAKLLLQHLHSH